MWHLKIPLHLYKWQRNISPDVYVDILCCRYNRNMRCSYNFDRLQIKSVFWFNSILNNKLKLCVTNFCFLCHWRQEPKGICLLRAALVVSDVPWQEVIAGPLHSFTAFCKVAFKDRHYRAPHLTPLSTLLFRVAAISCTSRQEVSLGKKLLRQEKKPAMISRGDSGKPRAPQPKPKRAPAWWRTWGRFHVCRFFSVLTASVIYYGVQMTVYAVFSGYLRNCSLHVLPDQETCKKSVLKVPGVGVASVHCEAQGNSLHGLIPVKRKQQPTPRNHVRKVLILKSLIFLQERRNPAPYCNQKKFQWSSCFTEILPWYSD